VDGEKVEAADNDNILSVDGTTLKVKMTKAFAVSASFALDTSVSEPVTFSFIGAYKEDNNISLGISEENPVTVYYSNNTDDSSKNRNAGFKPLTVNTALLPVNSRITCYNGDQKMTEKGLSMSKDRPFAIHNLKKGDVIRIEFAGSLYYAKSLYSKDGAATKGDALADMTTGDIIVNAKAYTVGSIDAENNYVVFYPSATTTVAQISINNELVLTSVPKPTISSSYTVNEDSYTYTISYMEGSTLHYTLPDASEQTVSGGSSTEVKVTKIGDLTAYASYENLTSETLSARVYGPTQAIEKDGVYDFSKVTEYMSKDYALGTIGYGEEVTVGSLTLYKPDAVVSKTLDRFAFAPKLNESGANAADWMLISAGRLRAKKSEMADTLAILDVQQGNSVKITYSGAALRYMKESTATLAEGTNTLTSGQAYEVKSDGTLLLTVPANTEKHCDITVISIATIETVSAPGLVLKDQAVANVFRIRHGSSSFGNSVTTYYTTDGTVPTKTNGTAITKSPYDLTLKESCILKVVTISETGIASGVVAINYVHSNSDTAEDVQAVIVINEDNTATVTNVQVGDETTTVTISGTAGDAVVTSIADNTFTEENTAHVAAIDLSETQVDMKGSRDEIAALKNINEATLIYLPSTASVTGTNVVTKSGSGDDATYACDDFQLKDGKESSVPHPFTATTAKLNRTFTKDTRCTVCLPYDFEASGGTFYKFTGISNGKVQMTEQTGTLTKNTPYIFVPGSDAVDGASATNVEVSISDAPQTENSEAHFTFVGTYEKTIWDTETASNIYGFAAKATSGATVGQFVRVGGGAFIEAYRAYLKYTGDETITDVASAPRRAAGMPDQLDIEWIDANGNTTSIQAVIQAETDEAPAYNMSGQRVSDSYKGLVIMNGKKVIR